MNLCPPPSSKLTLPIVIVALRRALFGWVGRGPLTDLVTQRICNRLNVILARVEGLRARLAAGLSVTREARVRTERLGEDDGEIRAPVEPVRVWPREFGWLTALMAHHATVYAGQLEMVLGEPEWVAVLEASPQARRLLRPVCRMLGMRASVLAPGTAADPVPCYELAPAKRVRVRGPQAPVVEEPFRIPPPLWERSWARVNRLKFGPGG